MSISLKNTFFCCYVFDFCLFKTQSNRLIYVFRFSCNFAIVCLINNVMLLKCNVVCFTSSYIHVYMQNNDTYCMEETDRNRGFFCMLFFEESQQTTGFLLWLYIFFEFFCHFCQVYNCLQEMAGNLEGIITMEQNEKISP